MLVQGVFLSNYCISAYKQRYSLGNFAAEWSGLCLQVSYALIVILVRILQLYNYCCILLIFIVSNFLFAMNKRVQIYS